MSYEGYEVWYCVNGHSHKSFPLVSNPAFDSHTEVCSVCGTKEFLVDTVDQTNGCQCDVLTDDLKAMGLGCGAHESVKDIKGYDFLKCPVCQGRGQCPTPTSITTVPCSCGNLVRDPACKLCFGSGTIFMQPQSTSSVNMVCPTCLGRGQLPVEVWDLTPLKREDEGE